MTKVSCQHGKKSYVSSKSKLGILKHSLANKISVYHSGDLFF